MSLRLSNLAHELIMRTRRNLILQMVASTLLWSCGAALLLLALARIVEPWIHASDLAAGLMAFVAAAAAGIAAVWRQRNLMQPAKVALWIEERLPQMRYALVALIEGRPATKVFAAQLEGQVRVAAFPEGAGNPSHQGISVDSLRFHLLHRARGAVLLPAMLLLAAVLAYGVAALGWQHRVADYWRSASTPASAIVGIDRFAQLHATVTPPAYTGWSTEILDDLELIRGLEGSDVVLHGRGDARGIAASLNDDGTLPLQVEASGSGWSIAFAMPQRPGALILSDADTRRVIILEPRSDAAPLVRLLSPERDEALVDDTGSLQLSASLSDDIRLARGWFEIIVASGEGEGNFEFSTKTLLETRFEDNRATLGTTVPIASFGLRPGGQLSIRAVGVDGNDRTGPNIGYSETRTIRLVRQQQPGNEAQVTPAPPVLDESLMSLRMLIVSTERLDARRTEMERSAFVRETAPLARHSETIREKIRALVDEAGQGGAFPVPALLTAALDAMWEATRNMYVAETGEALPHLRRAYESMKALTNLSRYFFRGQALPAHADVDGVRMTGEEPVSASARSRRQRMDTPRQRLTARLNELPSLFESDPAGAQELLTLMRVEALRELPQVAADIDSVLQTLRAGQDPASALTQLRGRLGGPPGVHRRLSEWGPAPLLQGADQP